MTRLKAALKKEFLQFLRDRMLIILILWTYTVEVVICTFALSFDVRNLELAVYDQDRSQLSRALAERFTATEYFGRLRPAASPLISTFAANLQQALLISFFVLFPVMFLSGTIVPVESMHPVLQYLSLLSPIRYYMEIALAIFLKGVGWSALWPQFLALLAIGSGLAGWSLLRLKKRLYA